MSNFTNRENTYVLQKLLLYILLSGLAFSAGAQPPSSLRIKKIAVIFPSQILDSLQIVPGSISVLNISPDMYTVSETEARLQWIQHPGTDSVQVRYRVFPVRQGSEYSHLKYQDVQDRFSVQQPYTEKNNTSKAALQFGGLHTQGSIGRTLAMGNNQDAVVNSDMNLQLQGYIGDSIELTAALSDNNVPIQPDGNTQDLRDFDRIYMQVRKNNWRAEFGDIDIRQDKDYFLRFYKRLQGAAFHSRFRLINGMENDLSLSGAITKGKFARNILQVQEGNQGPYRLYGANNELFFVVLANTCLLYTSPSPRD